MDVCACVCVSVCDVKFVYEQIHSRKCLLCTKIGSYVDPGVKCHIAFGASIMYSNE